MNNGLSMLTFLLGAAIGSITTWCVLKNKYEQIAREEIESVKEVFTNRTNESIEKEPVEDNHSKEYEELCRKVDNLQYTNYSSDYKNKEVDDMMDPYVIAPDEYGELDDYEINSLTYYADGVLADEMDNQIEDVDGLVGQESLKHFGEYEDDSVFVRNERLKCDYEILLDVRNYSDVWRQNE